MGNWFINTEFRYSFELSKLYKITINEILEPKVYEQITCFEEINSLDLSLIKTVFSHINIIDIVKSSMGASPEMNELLKNLFNNIDFNREKTNIGSVRITEIEDIHNKIVQMINSQLSKVK